MLEALQSAFQESAFLPKGGDALSYLCKVGRSPTRTTRHVAMDLVIERGVRYNSRWMDGAHISFFKSLCYTTIH